MHINDEWLHKNIDFSFYIYSLLILG